jgi:hypothetical protein
MENLTHAGEAFSDDSTVGHRPDHGGERGGKHVETDDIAPLGA